MASKLAQMQARFQKKQLQDKEEKLLKLYQHQQQRAIDRIGKNNLSSVSNNSPNSSSLFVSTGGGKVRQMFDERRQNKAGIDRSYPLEPLKQENTTNIAIFPAPSKNGVRINTRSSVHHNITTTSTLTSRPSNENFNKSSNQNVMNTTKGDIKNYRSQNDHEQNEYVFHKDTGGIVDKLNRHNIDDDIIDNVMLANSEQAVYIEVGGKLANVGGKRRSEITPKKTDATTKSHAHNVTTGLKASNTFRKEIKAAPLIKRTSSTKPSASPIRKPSPTPPSSSSSTMSKPQSRANQPSSARSAPARSANNPTSPAIERTPNTQRPSSKQTPRGPSAVQRDDLDECRYCHRRFASDRLQVHEDICARTAKKKRKQYDATKHRLEGTELVQFSAKAAKSTSKVLGHSVSELHTSKNKSKTPSKANNWRQKHEEFIATIRSAKVAQQHVAKGGKLSDLPPPPPSSNPDYVQCPHCGRRFNEAAAERHIPKCANFDFNKPKLGPNKGKIR